MPSNGSVPYIKIATKLKVEVKEWFNNIPPKRVAQIRSNSISSISMSIKNLKRLLPDNQNAYKFGCPPKFKTISHVCSDIKRSEPKSLEMGTKPLDRWPKFRKITVKVFPFMTPTIFFSSAP